MPTFDPNHPQNGDEVEADLLRENFNALNDKIEAIPDPLQGPPGPEGRHIASVDDNEQGQAILHMSDGTLYGPFTVASGPQGIQGPPGPNLAMRGDWLAWELYNRGDVIAYNGNVYIAFADSVSGPPPDGDPRWKLLTLTGQTGPAGSPGAPGERGDKGDKGDTGQQGATGEVTGQQLTDSINSALIGTARNPASIGPYTGDFSDPPTADQLRAFRDWANSFFSAAAR